MQSNISVPTGVLNKKDEGIDTNAIPSESVKLSDRKYQLVWRNIIFMGYFHIVAVYGFYLMFTSAKIATSIQVIILYQCGILGITAGAHRLWTHRSYKAKAPLRLLLTLFHALTFEFSVITWVKEHRVHHKFSDTDADPHNANRGFFFSQVGWLLCRKHPEVKNKGKSVNFSDLYEDPVLAFQHRYIFVFLPMISIFLPTLASTYLWDETFYNAFSVNAFRIVLTWHGSSLVNSAAHMFGRKPYDRNINPGENLTIAILTLGEGWHNYHHTFPWDYKTSELGKYSVNASTAFIDFFAKIGWAYDLKTVSPEMIKKRVLNTGDGTHNIWGWGDKDQPKEDYEEAIITHKM